MTIRLFMGFCGVVAAIFLAGCDTPGIRARCHPAAFAKLSPADQRTVLAGEVRNGMGVDAVYIAWGEPDQKQNSGGKDKAESWFYRRQLTLKAPMDSFDRWLPGNGVLGPTVPLTVRAAFGFGGIGNEGALQYQPHLLITDDTVKRADFAAGKLSGFEVYQAGFAPAR